MKLFAFAAAAALSLSFGGVAVAADRIIAELEAPVAAKTKLVVGGSVWSCEGSTCAATVQTSRATSLGACKALAKEVGRLSAFGVERARYETEQMSKCNTAAATPAAGATQTAAN